MKITTKTSEALLKEALNLNYKLVEEKDKDVYDSIQYTSKSLKEGKKVSKRDLADLVKSVMKVLGDSFIEPALAEEKPVDAENSTKKKVFKKSAEQESDKAEQSSSDDTDEEQVDKKSAKKSSGYKDVSNSVVSALETEVGDFVVTAFAEEFMDEADNVKYVRADDIKSMEDLAKEADPENIVFAFYWNKKQLKKCGYMKSIPSISTPKEFPNDLDLASCLYVSDNNVVTYVMSLYTEANYAVIPENFDIVDGIRYLGDIEFQIYRRVVAE